MKADRELIERLTASYDHFAKELHAMNAQTALLAQAVQRNTAAAEANTTAINKFLANNPPVDDISPLIGQIDANTATVAANTALITPAAPPPAGNDTASTLSGANTLGT